MRGLLTHALAGVDMSGYGEEFLSLEDEGAPVVQVKRENRKNLSNLYKNRLKIPRHRVQLSKQNLSTWKFLENMAATTVCAGQFKIWIALIAPPKR